MNTTTNADNMTSTDYIEFMGKAKILLESPQLVDTDYNEPVGELTEPNIYSEHVLAEQYEKIGSVESGNVIVDLHMQHNFGKYLIIGVIQSESYPKYKHGIFSLRMIELTTIDDSLNSLGIKCLSVNLVYTKNEYRFQGLSSKAYVMLAKMGYVILSDELHYKGAKNLWKRLAYLKGLVSVRVFDDANEKFVVDEIGNELYDGSNIPDDVIWSKDSSKMNILLVLSLK